MPEFTNVKKVKVESIDVQDRMRKDFGDVEALAVSIERYGLMYPIIVDRDNKLVAGERRLRACKSLGKKAIEVRFIDEVGEDIKKEIELEDNVRRKDFTWSEEVIAIKDLFEIKQQIYGVAKPRKGGGYSLDDLAEYLGRSSGSISMDISLARAMLLDDTLKGCKNKSVAYKRVRQKTETKIVAAIAEKVRERVNGSRNELITLIHGDSKVEMKKLPAETVDMGFTDPPYGKDIEHKDGLLGRASKFEDGAYPTLDLLDVVFNEYYRVLKENRVFLCFCDIKWYHELVEMLTGIGFNVAPNPIMWGKVSPGVAPMPYYYSNSYELIIHAMKGTRDLHKHGEKNYVECDRVPASMKIHPTQKPSRLLRYFIQQHTLPGEVVVDAFTGSAAILTSARDCDRKGWGCELDKDLYEKALVEVTREAGEEEI